jgi:hypothetical protein
MMTGAAKELNDRDEKEKEKNEQHNKGVSERVRVCTRINKLC